MDLNVTITYAVLLAIAGGLIGLVAVLLGGKWKPKTRKTLGWIGVVIVSVGIIGLIPGVSNSIPFFAQTVFGKTSNIGGVGITYSAGLGNQQNQGVVNVNSYQPTAQYSTIDHFSNVALTGGSAYYKAGGNKASTTALTNTDPNTQYQYWYSNSTYFVEPYSFMGGGTQVISNSNAYRNGSVTINGYDTVNSQSVSGGVYNTSLATGTAKIKFTILGSATTTQMPLGGILVVDANNTISQIVCSGAGISLTPSTKYQVTYTSGMPATHRYVIYEVAPGYDVSSNGLQGVTKEINCDFTSASSPGAGSPYYIKLIPANYYYVNSDGSFALDVEQKLNGLTTRTGPGSSTGSFFWG